jgi:hypothetical protein
MLATEQDGSEPVSTLHYMIQCAGGLQQGLPSDSYVLSTRLLSDVLQLMASLVMHATC